MDPIPAWFVSLMAFASAASLWLVRPMPRLIRISIIVPLVYFGLIYGWAASTPLDAVTRTIFIRAGLLAIFISIIINALVVRAEWRKGRRV
jgi:hypothetical protein